MARYRAAVDTPREREDVFAYLSDFSTTEEWDPGVVQAERLNDAAGRGPGSGWSPSSSAARRRSPIGSLSTTPRGR